MKVNPTSFDVLIMRVRRLVLFGRQPALLKLGQSLDYKIPLTHLT